MKKNIIYIIVAFIGGTTASFTQKTQEEIFNDEAKRIKNKIIDITKSEKEALKTSIDSINNLLMKEEISYEKAEDLKDREAQKRAKNIEEKVNEQNQKLSTLVKSKAQGEVKSSDNGYTLILSNKGFEFYSREGDTIPKRKSRTHFDVLFAFGYNNLISDQNLPGYDDNFSCNFIEWGGSFKTRLIRKNNLLNLRYGISFMYNYASPKDNYIFSQNGNITEVVDSGKNLTKNKFVNVYLAVPVHLEFNFGRRDSYKIGIGGFVGYNLFSEQRLKYKDNGRRIKDITRKDWNVNDFQYGLSTYIGYGIISLYAKYDLNPLFRNNPIDQHNLSIGIRLDL
ncbi:MAG: hypothetical protein WCY06_03260 [Flavobacteriaceae bacterium]